MNSHLKTQSEWSLKTLTIRFVEHTFNLHFESVLHILSDYSDELF